MMRYKLTDRKKGRCHYYSDITWNLAWIAVYFTGIITGLCVYHFVIN